MEINNIIGGGQNRRREIMEGYLHKYDEWITIRTRVYNANTTANIVRNGTYDNAHRFVEAIDRMIVDDLHEVTPVYFYNFGDNAYHTVRLLLKDPSRIINYMFGVSNYCIQYARFPKSVTTIDAYGFRGLGSSQTVHAILNKDVPPTAEGTMGTGTTSLRLYVPDGSLATYRAAPYYSDIASKIHPLSEYTGPIY